MSTEAEQKPSNEKLELQLRFATAAVQHWKQVTSYLATCHAATLESLPKNAPKATRTRLTEICEKAYQYMNGDATPPNRGCSTPEQNFENDKERCLNAVKEYGTKKPVKTT